MGIHGIRQVSHIGRDAVLELQTLWQQMIFQKKKNILFIGGGFNGIFSSVVKNRFRFGFLPASIIFAYIFKITSYRDEKYAC